MAVSKDFSVMILGHSVLTVYQHASHCESQYQFVNPYGASSQVSHHQAQTATGLSTQLHASELNLNIN